MFSRLSCASLRFFGILLLGLGAACAQLPTPRLTTIFPPGGRAGTTVEVTVAGVDLDEAGRLYFSQPQLTAQPKLDARGQPEANKFVIAIPADAPLGSCDVRVVGRFGLSNPRMFMVGDLPESVVAATNSHAASALAVAPDSVVKGRIATNSVAWFKFTAKQGRRVLVRCLSGEIDSRLEDTLALSDPDGRELARSRRGGLLDFTPPGDGEYRVKLHDATFRGGDEYFFRLTVSTGPWIDFIHPSAGLPGTKAKYTLYGRNLPGGSPAKSVTVDGRPLEQLIVEIELPGDALATQRLQSSALLRPGAAGLDGFEYRLQSPQGISNPVRVAFAAGPVITELPEAPPGVQQLTPPCELAGLFRPRGEATTLTFDAKKGEVWWLEVLSQRLGFPTDPFALLERMTNNGQGGETFSTVAELGDSAASPGGLEFNTASRDPAFRLEVKEDGAYRVQVRDLFNRGAGSPRHPFRLVVRRETPDFRLVALAAQPPKLKDDARLVHTWTPNLRRGETQVVKILALRRDGFNGGIQLDAEGLPAGVSCAGAEIPGGRTNALLAFTAGVDAAAWSGAVKIIGRAKVGGRDLTREARGGSVIWHVSDFNEEPVQSRLTRETALGLSGAETAPVTIEPVERKTFEAVAGTKVLIPLRIVRRGDFTETLKLRAVGVPALEALGELEVKTNSATLEIDLGKFKVPVGTHHFILQGQTKGKHRSYAAEARAADEALQQADKELAAASAETKKTAGENKAAAQKLAKDLAEKSRLTEATIVVCSAPITLLVKPEEKKQP